MAAGSGNLVVTADGQVGTVLVRGDTVEIRKSGAGVRFVHLPGHSYFGVLSQKLHWRGSNL